jgi:hypothetical protein
MDLGQGSNGSAYLPSLPCVRSWVQAPGLGGGGVEGRNHKLHIHLTFQYTMGPQSETFLSQLKKKKKYSKTKIKKYP